MRLTSSPTGALLTSLAPEVGEGAGGTGSGGMLGSWSATRWQYTSRGPAPRTQDLVVDLRGTVTLSLSAGSWILSWDLPGRPVQTIGGTWRYQGDRLELLRRGAGEADQLQVRLGADTMALSAEDSSWDFGDGASVAAGFVAVFVRL